MHCPDCGEKLVQTESGYETCFCGHTKLIAGGCVPPVKRTGRPQQRLVTTNYGAQFRLTTKRDAANPNRVIVLFNGEYVFALPCRTKK